MRFPIALRIGIAAAAVLLVAVGLFWTHRGDMADERVFEPGTTFGALLPEELGADNSIYAGPSADADGAIHPERGTGKGYFLRSGEVSSAALGAQSEHRLEAGAEILEGSELTCGAEGGARIDLPDGGLLFLRPLSVVQLRPRADGRVALRLLTGEAATVAGDAPLHLSVDGTDLLLTQSNGATLLRQQPSDAICLRGQLELHLENGAFWSVPTGHRLPAACARAPESEPAVVHLLDLDWYFAMLYHRARSVNVRWEKDGRSAPITAGDGAMLFLRLDPMLSGEFAVRFGDGKGRTFNLVRGRPFELRVPLASLGEGPRVHVTPGFNVLEARIFEVEPR
ncbi:MAG: FecR family protein [Planctomycetota bacterium]